MFLSYQDFLIESNLNSMFEEDAILEFSSKDEKRIRDFFEKGGGSDEKVLQLAAQQAKKISTASKAVDRAEAAESIIGKDDNPIAQIFWNRARDLGYDVDVHLKGNTKKDFSQKRGGTIFLPTYSAMSLWDSEITGQLSDGAWENSRPHDHWRFWADLKIEKGKPEVQHGGMWPAKTGYNLKSLIQYVGDRMVNIGRLGRAANKMIVSDQRYAAEYMPETFVEFQELRKAGKNYMKSIPVAIGKEYYKTTYTMKDLKSDLKIIKQAMATART